MKDGDSKPIATTYRPSFDEADVLDMVEVGIKYFLTPINIFILQSYTQIFCQVGIISRELGEKIMRAGRLDDEALERANEVEAGNMKNMQEMKNMQRMKNMFGRRRYELMKDEDTEDYWGQDEDRDGFMSRLVELVTNDNVS